ncbi:uncharacterized protein LOC123307396, partial [Coccinella septempunctata]|uniref:uncharacterized protein LOC123307396 n=1 Tax=Coccinella septempunctata TaxID=41139 RepID=UPI001D082CA3
FSAVRIHISFLSKMSRKRKNATDELQPTEKLTSDGDLLVKHLLEKQLSTQSNLQTELHRKKIFVSSVQYKSVNDYVSGISSLNELENTSQYVQKLEEFTAAGLSEDDLNFYLDNEGGIDNLKMKHKNLNIEMIEKRLEFIKDILHKYRTTNKIEEPSVSTIGKLQTECMLSIKPNSVETNLLKFALNNNKRMEEPCDAIESLKDFMSSLNNESDQYINITKLQKKVQRRLRALSKKVSSITLPTVKQTFELSEPSLSKNSKWDIKCDESRTNLKEEQHIVEKAEKTLKVPTLSRNGNSETAVSKTQDAGNRYTIRNGNIVNLKDLIDFTQCKKLSEEELRSIPKFAQYTKGSPSKILYLKNIHSLSSYDLEQLFKSFNFEAKAINILKGRMKGQAFVEIENAQLAEQALEQINGLIVKNKPVIIQFSTKTELPNKV